MTRRHALWGLALSGLLAAPIAQAATIKFWYPTGNVGTQSWLTNEAVPAFEKRHSGVHVDVSLMSWSEYEEKLKVAAAAGAAPDVYVVPGRGPAEYKELSLVGPIDDLVKTWGDQSDFVPSAWAGVTIAGVAYAVPWSIQGRVQEAHGDLLDAAGLPRAVPKTWDDVRTTAVRLTQYDGDRITRLGYGPPAHHDFYVWLHTAGGDLFSEDLKTPLLDSEAGLKALTFLDELFRTLTRGASPYGLGLSFPNQSIAMELGETTALGKIYQADPQLGEQVVVGPAAALVRHAVRVYVPALTVSPDSAQRQAAWAWLAYLEEPAQLLTYNRLIGRIPPRISLLKPENFAGMPQMITAAQVFQQYGIPHTFPEVDGQRLFDAVTKGLKAALGGKESPPEALAQMQQEWRAALQ